MTADNKNWPLLQRLPSQNDNKGGAGGPAVSDVHQRIEQPQPQHLNRSSSGNRLLLSRLNTGSITPPRHLRDTGRWHGCQLIGWSGLFWRAVNKSAYESASKHTFSCVLDFGLNSNDPNALHKEDKQKNYFKTFLLLNVSNSAVCVRRSFWKSQSE